MWEFLRKFGMEYCDMPTMLWNVAFMLRFLALDIDRRNDKGIPTIFYVTTLVTGLSYVYVYVVSVFWFVFIRCPETGDRLNAILVLALGTAAGICATKLVYVYFYQHTVRGLIDGYLACDAMVLPGSRFSDNLATTLRSVKKRALIAWVVLSFNGIYYIGEALIRPGRHMPEDCFIFYGLEPILDSPNFEIAFTLNVLALIFVCYLASNITAFFIIITGYIEAQMLALTVELKLLWNDAQTHHNCNIQSDIESDRIDDNASKEKLLNEYVKERLVDIAKFHMRNIALFRDVEKVFRGAIAGEFMFLMISLIGVLLVGLENAYIQLPFTLVMIGMDCLLGQKVMDASAAFTEALYDCKWENFDTSNRKIVLLMLQNAQKGMALSAGGLEPILDSPNFEIAFTLNVMALIFVCYLASNITAFFIIITGYIEAQMLALTVELKLLWNDAQTHYNCNIQSHIESDRIDDNASKEKLLNEYVKGRLIDIAKFHMRNIALFRDVEKVFRGAIAGEFMFLMTSLIGVLLVGLENAYIQLPFTLVMIGMDCLLGQRVMDASAAFTEALYDCKWENFDTSNRKIVLLMLQNAQKGMALSAGGIATLSYTCFMSIIKSIYSVFTALRSTV